MTDSRRHTTSHLPRDEIVSPQFEAATAAASRGWPVFPLSPGSKIPAVKRWETVATTDLDQLRTWWSFAPSRNVGIACGPAGLVVIDLDTVRGQLSDVWRDARVGHGRDVLALLARWAGETDPVETYTVLTPSVINGASACLFYVFND